MHRTSALYRAPSPLLRNVLFCVLVLAKYFMKQNAEFEMHLWFSKPAVFTLPDPEQRAELGIDVLIDETNDAKVSILTGVVHYLVNAPTTTFEQYELYIEASRLLIVLLSAQMHFNDEPALFLDLYFEHCRYSRFTQQLVQAACISTFAKCYTG